jgi:HPt (histidine-containing phosphotransfer) domain-containing protein
MEDEQMKGFIYVMTNPTVPGLAKVGMTTRDPTTRQGELSQATGVASPFTLVYSQPVMNCRAAEVWVHETLELAGFRHAANREFFNAPLHEIVRIVAGASAIGADEAEPADATVNPDDPHHLDGPALKATGDVYLQGRGVIRNPTTALRYYKLALKAEHWEALPLASSILRGDHGLKADPETELELINAAIDADKWWFLPMAASLFASQGQFDIDSAQGAWITYFSKSLQLVQKLEEGDSEESREQALALRKEAANVALTALEFAIEDKFDTSERGWWKVIYMLGDQLTDAIEEKYAELRSEHSDQRKTALLAQVLSAQLRYLSGSIA